MAGRIRPFPATARMTASAPRPSVISLIDGTVSEVEASMFSLRPNVLAIVSLCGNKSEVITLAPHLRARTDRMMPIGPCPITSTVSPGTSLQCFDTLHAGIHRLDERRLLKRHTVWNANYAAAADDPIHHPNVFGEAAAAGFVARGRSNFLVRRTLRKNLVLGSSSNRRTECDGTPSRDRQADSLDTPRPLRPQRPWFRGRRCAAPSASRSQSSSGRCRRCRRCGPLPATRRHQSLGPALPPGEHH